MNKWIVAARCRTLPLSLSAVILGIVLGFTVHNKITSDVWIILGSVSIILTAVLLQILSNYANDYGDQISGVDKTDRVGRISMVAKGAMSMADLKKGIYILGCLSLFIGFFSIACSFWNNWAGFGTFIILGFFAVVAAVTYTMGPSYSYIGLGDLFVFIFFGLVAVIGSEYMIAHEFSYIGILLGVNAGATSIMVLNVNNIRDYESDIVGGKNSVVVRLGLKGGKIYHLVLWLITLACTIGVGSYLYIKHCSLIPLTLLLAIIPLSKAAIFTINPNHKGSMLESMMKKTSLGASLINIWIAILFGILS